MIPKIIFTYWHSKNIPKFIKLCFKNWKKQNPDFEIKIFNKKSIMKLIDNSGIKNKKLIKKLNSHSIQFQSDIFRLYLLYNFGGVWIDASIILLGSLNKDIDFNSNEIYGFGFPNNNLILESWFLAAPKNHPFIRLWLIEFTKAMKMEIGICKSYFMDKMENFSNETKSKELRIIIKKIYFTIINSLPYLTIHACFIIVWIITKINLQEYKLNIKNSLEGPYHYNKITKWNLNKACDLLFKKNYLDEFGNNLNSNVIKLRGSERKYIIDNFKKKIIENGSILSFLK